MATIALTITVVIIDGDDQLRGRESHLRGRSSSKFKFIPGLGLYLFFSLSYSIL